MSLKSWDSSLRRLLAREWCVNNAESIMPAAKLHTSAATIENAVSETIKRINASVIHLVAKRVEIDSRIRLLQQAMQGLRYLEARGTFDVHCSQSFYSGSTRKQPVRRNFRQKRGGGAMTALYRGCRIALMEAENAATLEEIQARIVRRGSFLFSDSEWSAQAIHSALNAMADHGELRRLENGDQVLWQRTLTVRTSPLFAKERYPFRQGVGRSPK